MKSFLSLFLILSCSPIVFAFPALLQRDNDLSLLSTLQISNFSPWSHYAGASQCSPSSTLSWSCGRHCTAVPSFIPTASGGSKEIQSWYVGYDPTVHSIVVGHGGTDIQNLESVQTNFDIIRDPLDPSFFPGVPGDVRVHSGYLEAQAETATDVLTAVRTTMANFNATKVIAVGWSQGGAITLIDALHLHLQIPQAEVSVYAYGMPRVGNKQWANYIDSIFLGNITRINNRQDIVPTIPPRWLGYRHVSGEIRIQPSLEWVSCSGQDNTDSSCSTGAVRWPWDGSVSDHAGPYNGISLGC